MTKIGLRPFKPAQRASGLSVTTDDLRRLSRREIEALRHMQEGLIIKEVADRMGITHKTADNHCAHISRKLGLHGTFSLHDFSRSNHCAILLSDPALK